MEGAIVEVGGGYEPTEEYGEVKMDPNVDFNPTDSTELWLFEWSAKQDIDFNGQDVLLKPDSNGLLGTFAVSSGKSYEVTSYKHQDPEAVAFFPSALGCKTVRKVSRRVSLVHYLEPKELSEHSVVKQIAEKSAASRLTSSSNLYSTPTQGRRSTSSGPSSGNISSMRGGSSGVLASGSEVTPKVRSRRRADEPSRSIDMSSQDSGRQHSVVPSSGSLEQSEERISKKRRKSKT